MHTDDPLRNRVYRRLFTAQVVALLGTGLTTVALSLLAYDLAGSNAGAVLGIALALKMVAYVVVAPVVTGLTAHLPRRPLMVTLDVLRALTVAAMPFVTEIWHVYVLILVLSASAAGFTPTFQSVIPDILPDERGYTRALSLSRLAYELENLASPALAAALLTFVGYSALFAFNGVAFLLSAALVLSVAVPATTARPVAAGAWARVTRGIRRYLATPRLRGLLALNLAAAAASAMVIVNTVVYVRDAFGRADHDVAWALGAAGGGSMVAALALPWLLNRVRDRTAMLGGAALLAAGLGGTALVDRFSGLVVVWLVLGVGLAVVQTPAGRLVQRSAGPDDRPALFAAQFSLSHACWLITYPVAGLAGAALGLPATALILAGVAAAATAVAALAWPARDRAAYARRRATPV